MRTPLAPMVVGNARIVPYMDRQFQKIYTPDRSKLVGSHGQRPWV